MAVDMLEEKIGNLQKSRLKKEELERVWGIQIEKMVYMMLDRVVEKIQTHLDDFKIPQSLVKSLE